MIYLLKIVPNWEQFIALTDKVIWPITVLIGLLFFKKHLAKVIDSLGSLKAGAGGIEMTFQNQINEVKGLLGPSTGALSKSAGQLKIKGSRAETPYQQLLEIRDALNNKILRKAIEYNISTENTSTLTLSDNLKDVGAITIQNARNFTALLNLTNSANESINQSQVNQVKALYNALNF